MLDELPSKIVQMILKRYVLERRQILSHITQTIDSRDLKRLCEVWKNISNGTLSILYQAIILGVAEEWELKDFDAERLRKCSTTNDHLRYVKYVHHAADFYYMIAGN